MSETIADKSVGLDGVRYIRDKVNQKQDALTTGSGIDITSGVISATNTGQFKTLTSADKNWPENNPTGIALWLLPAGIYELIPDTNTYINTYLSSSNSIGVYAPEIYIIGDGYLWNGNNVKQVLAINNPYDNGGMIFRYEVSQGASYSKHVLDVDDVQDYLTSTQTNKPLSAKQGKVLNDKIEGRVKTNAGAPTTATVGTVGQVLEDTANGKLYICTAVDNTDPQNIVYTWTEVGAGGGPTVVQTIGTSTTDVMSQDAATKMVYKDANTYSVCIGDSYITQGVTGEYTAISGSPSNSKAIAIGIGGYRAEAGQYAVSIGSSATARDRDSIAIGNHALCNNYGKSSNVAIGEYARIYGGGIEYAIALGAHSHPTQKGQMDISTLETTNTYGYNNSQYRLLTGLYDPQSAHDAATKGYVDSHAGGIIELTTSDYNYDPQSTGTNTAIALWLLNPGLYRITDDAIICYISTGEARNYSSGSTVLITDGNDDTDTVGILFVSSNTSYPTGCYVTSVAAGSEGQNVGGGAFADINSVTSILNQRVQPLYGDPTQTTTVGTVGALGVWVDTTGSTPVGHLYLCTKCEWNSGTSEWDVIWQEITGGSSSTGLVTLSYGHSTWQDFLDAYNAGKIVYCKASSANDPGSGTQGRMAFMAFITFGGTTPTKVEFQYVRSVSPHTDSQQGDQIFVYTLANTSGGTWTVTTREMSTKIVAGAGLSSSYSNGVLTLSSSAPTVNPGEARVLTQDDYDWPTAEPTGIATWKLTSGMYVGPEDGSTKVRCYFNSNATSYVELGKGYPGILLVQKPVVGAQRGVFWYFNSGSGQVRYYASVDSDGNNGSWGDWGNYKPIDMRVYDALTGNNGHNLPLSAHQGYLLDQEIGDLSTLTTTDKTSIVAAINELAARL